MLARAAQLSIILAIVFVVNVLTCGPGRGSGHRRGRRKMTPLVFKQHVPNVSENTLGASGPAEGSISRSDARFNDLVINNNPDIVFKNRRGTNNDRIMSQRCREKLNTLSVLVMNQWPGVQLRVIESWLDDDALIDVQSLHLEGRAVDLTTSDRDRSKYGMLARLAVDAGFDWVYFESRAHIHCSVKSDSSMAAGPGGCFSGDATVTLSSGQKKTIDNVTIGERVLTYDAQTEQFHYDAVITFLHRRRASNEMIQYLIVETEYGQRLTVTPGHLVYAATPQHTSPLQPVFAGHLQTGSYVIVNTGGNVSSARVVRVSWSRDSSGVYAPITERGTIVVDDVIVSCYAEFSSDVTAHACLAPLRFAYYMRELIADWLPLQRAPANSDVDGIHWYAELLRRLAKTMLPQQFWWSSA